jgi:hypothetical protein
VILGETVTVIMAFVGKMRAFLLINLSAQKAMFLAIRMEPVERKEVERKTSEVK